MSTHCGRFPNCGCPKEIGIKCGLPDNDPRLGQKEELPQNKIDRIYRKSMGEPVKPKRKYPTNYTPPKKKRK